MEVPGKDATWYIDAGQGMMATIRIAAEKDGYTVTDRGTYIKYNAAAKGDAPLKILVEGDQGPPEPVQRHDGQPRQVPKGQAGSRQEVHQLVDQPQYPEGHRQLPA